MAHRSPAKLAAMTLLAATALGGALWILSQPGPTGQRPRLPLGPRPRVTVPVPQYPAIAAGADFDSVIRERLEIAPPIVEEILFPGGWCGTSMTEVSDWARPDIEFLESYPVEIALGLADLEGPFGNDPRYRLLCYRYGSFAAVPADERQRLATLGIPSCYWHLEEARHRGIADAPLLLEAFRATYAAAWNNLQTGYNPSLGNSEEARRHAARSRTNLGDTATPSKVLEQYGEQLSSILKELQIAAPDEALPYYCRAVLAYDAKDTPGMWQAIERGNVAKKCDALSGYPRADVMRELITGALPNPFVSSRLALLEPAFSDSDKLRSILPVLIADARHSKSAAKFSALATYVTRMGQLGQLSKYPGDEGSSFALLEQVLGSAEEAEMFVATTIEGQPYVGVKGYRFFEPKLTFDWSNRNLPAKASWQWVSGRATGLPDYFVDYSTGQLSDLQQTEMHHEHSLKPWWQACEGAYSIASSLASAKAAAPGLTYISDGLPPHLRQAAHRPVGQP